LNTAPNSCVIHTPKPYKREISLSFVTV
jgi:hypothetical protein